MKTKMLMAVGLVLLVAGVWAAAQELQVDPEYATRATALKADDAAGHFELAKWALKKGLYHEASLEADKLLALDSGDLRGKYLKQQAEYYQNGTAATGTGTEAGSSASSALGVEAAGSGEAAVVAKVRPAAPMTKDEVDKLYKMFERNLGEFKTPIQPMLVSRCGNDNCHGNAEHAGRFYLRNKNLGDRTVIAENFRAVDRYVNPDAPERSRLLAMSVAKNDEHKTDKAPIFATENDAAYKLLKTFLGKLPNRAERMWGPSH